MVTSFNIDGIPSSTTFEKLKLSVYEEIELDFECPAKFEHITLEVKAKIIPINEQEPKEYISKYDIGVEKNKILSDIFCELYLRLCESGYELYVLGKNGKPKEGAVVQMEFNNKYFISPINTCLQTDNHGKISLGKLDEIVSIQASLINMGDIKAEYSNWQIKGQPLEELENVRICESDQLIIPLLHNELKKHKISFVETLENGSVLRNCLSLLKTDKGKLIIAGLKEGFYELNLKDVTKKFMITVIKGRYW